ncbi:MULTISPECIES: sigma-70 family RNA polymerase sigma factor [Rossellomorea]|uniref:sigma-70 family RNA polymerase sigma factor n=1 Tax=unclassified Rossellomorea TaxID=2837526 RepID=UPI002D7A0CE5|nr:sigma-70 family RNA polymerase sigma factor [Rossellomorea aquimaris]WRP08795.1 sigma-70 family RNA polymerase sigma factor [Rossellomorea aquimaris]
MDPLIEKAKNGSEHAFRMLIEMHKQYVFKCIFGVLRNQKDAEDASQEVWMKIYTSLPQYGHQGFKTWMTRIAVNHAIDCKRRQARQEEELVDELPVKESEDAIERRLLRKEQKQLVLRHLEEVPESYREVIEGFYIKEKSYQELANEQHVQVKTIETKLYRARLWMRKHWKEEDFI